MMLQNGANPKDVQSILGHSTLGMTMRVYARSTQGGKCRLSAPCHSPILHHRAM